MNERTRIRLYARDCIGCGRCVATCRRGVLRLIDNGACRIAQIADASRCAGCGHCARACKRHAIVVRKPRNEFARRAAIGCRRLLGMLVARFRRRAERRGVEP